MSDEIQVRRKCTYSGCVMGGITHEITGRGGATETHWKSCPDCIGGYIFRWVTCEEAGINIEEKQTA